MSGAEAEPSVLERPRRSVPSCVESPPLSADVLISSPLDDLAAEFRSTRVGHQFSSLDLRFRSDLYHRAADVLLKNETPGFTYMMAAEQVAALYNIKFDKCDRQKIKMSVCNRIHARQQYKGAISILID